MPKASSSTIIPSASNNLKRNQACHQCRRRKLKWSACSRASCTRSSPCCSSDAGRPCATCMRSNAIAHSTSPPECTYDENPESRPEPPPNKYERLEARINQLETLLLQQNGSSPAEHTREQNQYPTVNPSAPFDPLAHNFIHDALSTPFTLSNTPPNHPTPHSSALIDYSRTSNHPSNSRAHTTHFYSPVPTQHSSNSASSFGAPDSLGNSPPAPTPSPERNASLLRNLFWPSWPARLPTPELLQHLVEVFFASLPHASRILHRPSFIAALSLPPTAPGFPETSILHAICAVASIFSPAVAPPPLPDPNEQPADETYRPAESRDDSFGEMQAKYAKEAQDEARSVGEGLFSGLQSVVILSWYYFYHARWADMWLSTGEALRYCVPLRLNICEPQVPLVRSWKTFADIMPPSRTAEEEETRRNTFWLAYAMDRIHSTVTEFAMTLDDEDITQVLPSLGSHFENGTAVSVEGRQRLTTPYVLTTHPLETTDSFVLYIKGTMLLSKVKIFNLRFKAKFHGTATQGSPSQPGEMDPRDTPAFKALDGALSAFKMDFPLQYEDPIPNGVVDSHLYVAHLAPHTATLLLHDPHANARFHDDSSEKLTAAAHAVLELVYAMCSTSYDITLLDPVVVTSWWMAARELVREMRIAQRMGQGMPMAVLRSEVEVIRLALVRLGERLPLAFRQTKMLDLLLQDVPDCAMEASPFGDVAEGSLEQLLLDGMR